VIHGFSNDIPTIHGFSNDIPTIHGFSNDIPTIHGFSNDIPTIHGFSNDIPMIHGFSNDIPMMHGSPSSHHRDIGVFQAAEPVNCAALCRTGNPLDVRADSKNINPMRKKFANVYKCTLDEPVGFTCQENQ